MKLNGNRTPSASVPESVYCMTGSEYIAELRMLRDPVWAEMSLDGLCYILTSAADFWVILLQSSELLVYQAHSNGIELKFLYLTSVLGGHICCCLEKTMFLWF